MKMNNLVKLRRRSGRTVDDMARLLAVQPKTLQRCEYGDFDHVPEIEAEFERRLVALGILDLEMDSSAA
jgi:DNA-binding XRE family transcriptional regulator